VHGTRGLIRPDLIANTAVPDVEVSPDDGQVTLGGRVLECDPVGEVPLSRRYLLT
jgi:urease subunit alpha